VHVGLNLVFLVPGETGGMETYARELIPELVAGRTGHRFTAFVNREVARRPGPWNELTESVIVPVDVRRRIEWVRAEQQLLPPMAMRAGVDLLHSLASTSPAWGRFRRVVTIHDLIYRLIPEAHFGLRSLGMQVLVPLAAHRAHRIIVPAASTRSELGRLLGVRPDKVDVVPEGIGTPKRADPVPEATLRSRLGVGDRPIVLSVSAKRPHKNLIRLITSISLIPQEVRPVLVLPGYPTPHEPELQAHALRLGLRRDVCFLGWVSPEELEGLYAAAACFVFPSLAEGFGLPVLEAMARGVPVACSDRGALAEVAGEAALKFDPESERSIADSIRRLLDDDAERERMRAKGLDQAGHFSWKEAAAGTLRCYERAASGHVHARNQLE
jgi:glycosyltransferase involved in cell wall biosynthesis